MSDRLQTCTKSSDEPSTRRGQSAPSNARLTESLVRHLPKGLRIYIF